MRTQLLVLAFGLVAACDEPPIQERALEAQKVPIESTEDVSVVADPKPDPSVDNRNAPVVEPSAPGEEFDLEQERSTLARLIEGRIQRVDASIAELEKRGAAAKDDVAMLRAKRDQARAKLIDLEKTSNDNWIAYKRDVYDAWEQLDRDVEEAMR